MISTKLKEGNCIGTREDTLCWASVDALPGAFSWVGGCALSLDTGRRGLYRDASTRLLLAYPLVAMGGYYSLL